MKNKIYKIKTSFIPLEFLGGNQNLNVTTKTARIKGSSFSGLDFSDLLLEFTILPSDLSDGGHIQIKILKGKDPGLSILESFVGTLCETKPRGISKDNKFLIFDYPFTTTILKSEVVVYLSVSTNKRIEDYLQYFLTDQPIDPPLVNKNILDNIDLIFSDDIPDSQVLPKVENTVPNPVKSKKRLTPSTGKSIQEILIDKFSSDKGDILENLEKQIQEKKQEFSNERIKLTNCQNTINNLKSNIQTLDKRIVELKRQKVSPIPYFYWLSPRVIEDFYLNPDDLKKCLTKLHSMGIVQVDPVKVMDIFKKGYFEVRFAKLTEDGYQPILSENLINYKDLPKMDFLFLDDGKLKYTGELSWSEICMKIECEGFQTSIDFNNQNNNDTQN